MTEKKTTIPNTVRTRRGLRRALAILDANVLAIEPLQPKKAELDELKVGIDWIRQEATEPEKKGESPEAQAA